MQDINVKSKKRLMFTAVVVALIVFFLIYRLIKIQVFDANELKIGALAQWNKTVEIKSDRGTIYDRNGKSLAVNITAFTVWANPLEIDKDSKEEVASKLAEPLELSSETVLELISRESSVVKLRQSVSRDRAMEIRDLRIKGVSIVEDSKRYYPLGNFAAYILGFTDIDNNGLYGIERVYDTELSGVSGVWLKATDAANRQLPYEEEKVHMPQNGTSLVLTIDERIQEIAEEASQMALEANKAKTVTIIVQDPLTGGILAMATKPDYDPNNPRTSPNEIESEEWKNLPIDKQQEKWYEMWRNYSINDLYEPGSTFKIVTAAAALEEGSANLNTHYFCNGFIRDIKGVTLRCASWWKPHGDQDFVEAFANSCNPAFVAMARQVGKEKMLEYTKAFGFGQLTGVDLLGEQRGLIPRNVESIKEVNLATLSYGHGIAVTPIQMINAISVVANGGNLMKPYVVSSLIDPAGNVLETNEPQTRRQVISKETADKMLFMLEKTVLDGTGRKAYVPGYRVGGKTGTASKIIDGRYVENKYISSFGGVAPVDDPKITVLVIVDEPTDIYYGGTVAGPAAQKVIEESLSYLEVPRKYTQGEIESIGNEIIVPNVVGLPISEGGKVLKELGLNYTTEYELFNLNTIIQAQFPAKDSIVRKGDIIDLYLMQGTNELLPIELIEDEEGE